MKSLDDYTVFLDAWQAIIDDTNAQRSAFDDPLADFEDYASYAVHSFLETGKDNIQTSFENALGKHDCAAILTTKSGLIRQTNIQARHDNALIAGKTLTDCGISLMTDMDIPTLISGHTQDSQTSFYLIQAEDTATQRYITLAISSMPETELAEPLFLILLITPPDATIATQMLSQKFNFTSAEAEIVKSFLNGASLRAIATDRKRAYTTIRNQFQSILEKSECASQTELFRLSYSLLKLLEHTSHTSEKLTEASAQTMTIPRPKGRVVELVLSGDQAGRPVLNLPSLFGHGLTADIEEALNQKEILFISVMRPGFGGTSPPSKGQSSYDCLASDVRAILDSLEIDECPCIARASAARAFYNLLTRLPDRITHGLVVNGMIPRNYVSGKTVLSKWTTALMSASILSYPIAKLILGTGNSLLMRSAGASFLLKMYQESDSDCQALQQPTVASSIKKGVQKTTQQGLTAGAKEMVDAFQDWSADLDGLQTPVTIYHGRNDPNVPILGVTEFAQDNPDFLFIQEQNGGGQLCYSHFDRLLELV